MTNFLLFIIAITLLFGAGSVLGFFNFIFWILVFIVVIIGALLFTKEVAKEKIEQFNIDHETHLPSTVILWMVYIIIGWIIVVSIYKNQKSDIDSTSNSTPQFPVVNEQKDNFAKQNLLTSTIGHTSYPQANRKAFLDSCSETSGGLTKYCDCLLDFFETNYTLEEFSKIEGEYARTQLFPQAVINATASCIDENNY